MRFLHKWQGKISKIVIEEGSPSNTPNDNHQLKIVSLQNNPVFRNILCTFFGLRKKSQENLITVQRNVILPFHPL